MNAKSRWLAGLALFLTLWWAGGGSAQEPPAEIEYNISRAHELFDAGQSREALTFYATALGQSAAAFGANSAAITVLLGDISDRYWNARHFDLAEVLYRNWIALIERDYGTKNGGLAQPLSYLSVLLGTQGRFAEAQRAYVRCVSILETEKSRDNRRIGMAAFNLATAYEYHGRLNEARVLYTRAVEIWQAATDTQEAILTTAKERLAGLDRPPPARPMVAAENVVELTEEQAQAAAADAVVGGLITDAGLGGIGQQSASNSAGDGDAAGAGVGTEPAPVNDTATVVAVGTAGDAVAPSLPSVPPSLAAASRDFRVHLASVKDVEGTHYEWERLKKLYPDLLRGLDLSVVSADLGPDKGVFYQIQAGPLSESSARALCAALAERDAWCRAVHT